MDLVRNRTTDDQVHWVVWNIPATAVSLARVGGLDHFPSDVVAGAVLGELIGRYVVDHHAQLAQ